MPQAKKYATLQAKNREASRRRRLREETTKTPAARTYSESRHAGDFDRLAARVHRERVAAGEIAPRDKAPVIVPPARDPDGLTAVQRYRLEKAKSDERLAPVKAAELASIKDALARADGERVESQRGGRPKKSLKLNLHSDPANALVDALGREL